MIDFDLIAGKLDRVILRQEYYIKVKAKQKNEHYPCHDQEPIHVLASDVMKNLYQMDSIIRK